VAAGRAFTDLIAHVPAGFIESRGIPADAGRAFDAHGFMDILAALTDVHMMAGGTGANAAATMAALGGKAGFFGKVARDDVGAFFLKDFERRGVDVCCDPYADGEVGSAVCLVLLTEDGHRSFATYDGCADSYTLDDFRRFDFGATDFFMGDAELITLSATAHVLRQAVEIAKEKTRVVINFHNVHAWPDYKDMARFVAEKADIVIGNRAEFASFARAQHLPGTGDQVVVTTHGADGVEALCGGSRLFVPGVKPTTFVSSVGAGDAFMAGFLFALSKGLDMTQGLNYGIQAAVAVLGETGARPTKPLALQIGN